ncbi:MAG: hypothetical protein Q9165_000478 [Trypethelium subeluteriae]
MSASVADIISYVGIPLAVLGVLPTLYTCLKCLLTLRLIRSTLQHSGVINATTRSSLLSGIIEIEIPRKRLTPFDRDDPRYLELCPRPSLLRGGTWTLFQWKEMTIGLKSYRVQFHDEVRMPQAEVEFEPLVAFLLDRGAVPNSAGFALLRHSGLWTPAGTKLLSSPRGAEAVLSVTASDDSDGILSLALDWEPEWQKHHATSLPPYWIRIEGPPARKQPFEGTEWQEDSTEKWGAGEEGNEGREEKGEVLGKEVLVTVVERVLYLMVDDPDLAAGVVGILELWKEWGEVSGMTVQHLQMLRRELRRFAYSAVIMGIIKEAATAQASSVVSDLQECLGAWKKVRLG